MQNISGKTEVFEVFAAYQPLFRVPGARRFMLGSLIARMGGAMFGISVLVMVSERRDSYALAGAINGVALVVLAITGPILGGLIDRYGQSRVARPFIFSTTFFSLGTAILSWQHAPAWTLFAAYALSAIVPTSGPMSRARWAGIFRDDPDKLHTAMSLEQVADEISFVLAPILAVVLSTMWFPEAGFIVATSAYALGLTAFLSARTTEPAIVAHQDRPAGVAVRRPGIVVIALVLAMTGTIFGSNEVVTVAFADEAGNTRWAGVILGAFALGSMFSALYFGARGSGQLTKRLVIAATAMLVLEVPTLWASSPAVLMVVMLVAGSATAPTLITALSLTERLVPRALVTEALSVSTTALVIGLSLGAFIAGLSVEKFGAQTSYLVPISAGAIAVVILLLTRKNLSAIEGMQTYRGAVHHDGSQ